MASKEESLSEVHIGDVTGGIHGSIIAGRDVTNATITIGGQPTPAAKEPTVDELKQLLAEIQGELAEITAQQEALKEVPSAVASVNEATRRLHTGQRVRVNGESGEIVLLEQIANVQQVPMGFTSQPNFLRLLRSEDCGHQ